MISKEWLPDERLEVVSKIAKEMIEMIKDRIEGFAVSAPFGNVKMALASLGKASIDTI